jgi:hypothetical protein
MKKPWFYVQKVYLVALLIIVLPSCAAFQGQGKESLGKITKCMQKCAVECATTAVVDTVGKAIQACKIKK